MRLLKKNVWISFFLFLISCESPSIKVEECFIVDIRDGIENLSTLNLKEELESVMYSPLQITSDDASLIDGVLNFTVTDKYIYVIPAKEGRVVLFDKRGNFVKTLIPFGQGPGELQDVIATIQADETNDRLYLFCANQILVYTLDGEFVTKYEHGYQTMFQYKTGDDNFASVSFPYIPFQTGGFGLGIFTSRGDTVMIKNNFYSSIVPPEKSGFTICLAMAYSDIKQSILFKAGSNDTIYRVSNDTISPICILNLKNSNNEIVRALDVTDFSALSGKLGEDKDIFVSDMFETFKSYYFRFMYNQGYYVCSVNKMTGEFLVEKCTYSGTLEELSDMNLLYGMLGTKGYHDFPIWGRVIGDELVQVVTPSELNLYSNRSDVKIPDNLNNVEEDGNPVFIFYKLKK